MRRHRHNNPSWPVRIRDAAVAVFALCGLLLSPSARLETATVGVQTVGVQVVPEYTVKAGYLLLFARYVQWPELAFTSPDAPLVIAVLGRDPFGSVLDETLREQRIGTRSVRLIRVAQPTANTRAHLVYLAGMSARDEQQWLTMLRTQPVLTVSESAGALDNGALDNGAIVRLVQDGSRIRFDVDWAAAVRANLKITSPMLKSAREVRGLSAEINIGVQP
jgi:YfiR/HmsC-like